MVFFRNTVLLFFAAFYAAAANCSEYGSWYIYVLLRGGAQGNRNGDTYVEHSSNPGVISHWGWAYNPETKDTKFFTNDTTLNTTRLTETARGLQEFQIRQTVLGIPLKGLGTFLFDHEPPGNGRSADGNTTIISELDS